VLYLEQELKNKYLLVEVPFGHSKSVLISTLARAILDFEPTE
jgi:hypothetical protein